MKCFIDSLMILTSLCEILLAGYLTCPTHSFPFSLSIVYDKRQISERAPLSFIDNPAYKSFIGPLQINVPTFDNSTPKLLLGDVPAPKYFQFFIVNHIIPILQLM